MSRRTINSLLFHIPFLHFIPLIPDRQPYHLYEPNLLTCWTGTKPGSYRESEKEHGVESLEEGDVMLSGQVSSQIAIKYGSQIAIKYGISNMLGSERVICM